MQGLEIWKEAFVLLLRKGKSVFEIIEAKVSFSCRTCKKC